MKRRPLPTHEDPAPAAPEPEAETGPDTPEALTLEEGPDPETEAELRRLARRRHPPALKATLKRLEARLETVDGSGDRNDDPDRPESDED